MKSCPMKLQAGAAEILLYEDIGAGWLGGIGAKQFADDLKALGKVNSINVRLNSEGGSVFEGVAIYNTLKRHPARVIVDIDGMALSVASLIAMAGDEIRMAANAMMMVHDPWILTGGNSADLRKEAELLDKVKDNIVGTYAGRTGIAKDVVAELMTAETWMGSEEATARRFADSVTGERRVAAKFDPERFRNVPEFAKERASVDPGTPRKDERRARVANMGLRLRRDEER